MNHDRPGSLEHDLTTLFAETAPSRAPDGLLDDLFIASGERRPRPRWLALIKEPPMRFSSRVAVGSPTVRVAALVILLMAMSVLTAGGVVVGATLLASPGPDTGAACAADTGTIEVGPATVMPHKNSMPTVLRLSDGRVLLWGPFEGWDAELYEPATGAFRRAGVLPSIVGYYVGVLLPGDRVLAVPWRSTVPAALWDPTTETFSESGAPARARGDYLPTALPDGRVLLVGGNDEAADFAPIPDAEIWDPETGMFAIEPTLAGVGPDTVTVLDDGRVLLVHAPTAWTWDPATGALDATGAPTAPFVAGRAVRLADGRVLLVSGLKDGLGMAEAEVYDPDTGTFTPTGPLASGRFAPSATLLGDGKVLVVGGQASESGDKIGDAEIWDPATGTFSPAGTLLQARVDHTATLLEDCSVLIVGGAWDEPPSGIERWVPARRD
jgi:hypothetical protein